MCFASNVIKEAPNFHGRYRGWSTSMISSRRNLLPSYMCAYWGWMQIGNVKMHSDTEKCGKCVSVLSPQRSTRQLIRDWPNPYNSVIYWRHSQCSVPHQVSELLLQTSGGNSSETSQQIACEQRSPIHATNTPIGWRVQRYNQDSTVHSKRQAWERVLSHLPCAHTGSVHMHSSYTHTSTLRVSLKGEACWYPHVT